MPQKIKKSLVIGFKTNKGKDIKLTINKPKEGLTGQAIASVMQSMIDADVLGEEGKIIAMESAAYVTQQSDSIELM